MAWPVTAGLMRSLRYFFLNLRPGAKARGGAAGLSAIYSGPQEEAASHAATSL